MSLESNPQILDELKRRLTPIRLFAFDVDGVVTDGGISMGPGDLEVLRFDVKDGSALSMALRSDYLVAFITGRKSPVTVRRAEMLGIKEIHIGVSNKRAVLAGLAEKYALSRSQILFMGDDILDLSAFSEAGFCACPADAAEDVLGKADYRCSHRGGRGAVREVIELVMRTQGTWAAAVERIIGRNPHVTQ